MFKFSTLRVTFCMLACLAMSLSLAGAARADIMQLVATPTAFNTAFFGGTGFTIVWDDTIVNGLLDPGEPLTMTGIAFVGGTLYQGSGEVLGEPVLTIPVFEAGLSPFTNGTGTINGSPEWVFTEIMADPLFSWPEGPHYFWAGYWTYDRSAVPLPPSVCLLGSGLVGLGLFRLRRL